MAGTIWHRHVAASLDGKIARPDGSVEDWLAADFPAEDFGFDAFSGGVDAILMGRGSYEAVRRHGDWPYPGKPTVVMTTRPLPDPPRGAQARSGDMAAVAAELEEQGHRRVWILGGGAIVRSMIAIGKLDVLEMALIPTVLGEGVPLFPRGTGALNLRLAKCETKAKGALHLVYERAGWRGAGRPASPASSLRPAAKRARSACASLVPRGEGTVGMSEAAARGAKGFFGWQVVGAAFVLAVLTWGINFYGPSVYLHALHAREGWPLSLVSAAITLHFLASAAVVARLPALLARWGPVATVRAGMAAAALGVAGWGNAGEPWHLVPAALLTAAGWALTSGAAINAIVSPWFDRRRPAALAMAYNGASAGGIAFAPLWAALIAAWGFGSASLAVAAGAVLVAWPLAGRWFRPTPDALGLHPDGAASAPPPRPASPPTGPLWRQPAFRSLSLSFALGLTAQMGLLTVLFSMLAPSLGEGGAGLAMSAATACAVVGRTAVGALLPEGADRRVAGTLNFLLQAAGSAALAVADGGPAPLVLGALLFGLGIGNLLSLPPLIAQRDWPPAEVARVVAVATAVNQAFYAFGPALFGAAMETFGAWAPPILAGALQLAAAAVLMAGRRR